MKRLLLLLALTTCVGGVARADWKDLKPGMDARTAWLCAGTPLLRNRGPAAETWTYDNGGYIMLSGGRVTFWEAPKPVTVGAFARTAPRAAAPAVVKATPAPVTKPAPVAGRMVAMQE